MALQSTSGLATSLRQDGEKPNTLPPIPLSQSDPAKPKVQRRPRPTLSCLDCRRKKLKCDRLQPCQQCVKIGRAASCVFRSHVDPSDSAAETDDRPPKRPRLGSDEREQRRSSTLPGIRSLASPGALDRHQRPGTDGAGNDDIRKRIERLERELRACVDATNGQNGSSIQSASSVEISNGSAKSQFKGTGGLLPFSHPNHSKLGFATPTREGHLDMKGARCRYHGPNNVYAMLEEFDDVKEIIQHFHTDPSMKPLWQEIRWLRQTMPKKESVIDVKVFLDCHTAFMKMNEILPSRPICDRFMRIYFQNYEKTFRILYIPSFLETYTRFWDQRETNLQDFSLFLPQLIATLVIAASMDEHEAAPLTTPDGSVFSRHAFRLTQAWLDGLDERWQIDFSLLQTQALQLLALQALSVRPHIFWKASGVAVRNAMAIGLHRDPSEFDSITPFHSQMRRRLWMSLIELDLQASHCAGQPAMLQWSDFTTQIPTNLDDTDISESMLSLPPAKPLDTWTGSLLQILLAESFAQRVEALRLGQAPFDKSKIRLMVQYCESLENTLQNLPTCAMFGYTIRDEKDGPGRLLGRILLDIYIRRSLLPLYQRLSHAPDRRPYEKGRISSVESSFVLLAHQDALDPKLADPDLIDSGRYWNLFHVLCRYDLLQAAFYLCYEIKTINKQKASGPTHWSPGMESSPRSEAEAASTPYQMKDTLIPWTKASLIRAIESILQSLLSRVDEFSNEVKDIFRLSVVLQAQRMPVNGSRERKEAILRERIQSIASACRENIARKNGYVQANPDHTQSLVGKPITPASSTGGGYPRMEHEGGDPRASSSTPAAGGEPMLGLGVGGSSIDGGLSNGPNGDVMLTGDFDFENLAGFTDWLTDLTWP
ncbi:hypothetical protein MMC25_000143 [Agyrium rufum]|nr:hypothetical protein [Agyrium rufum]